MLKAIVETTSILVLALSKRNSVKRELLPNLMKAFAILAFSFEQSFHALEKIVHWWTTLIKSWGFFLVV